MKTQGLDDTFNVESSIVSEIKMMSLKNQIDLLKMIFKKIMNTLVVIFTV